MEEAAVSVREVDVVNDFDGVRNAMATISQA